MAEPQRPQLSIPLGYPRQLSNEQITSTIDNIQTVFEKGKYNINVLMRFAPLLQIGANELQSRNVDRQAQISREYADTSKRLSLISVVIAVIAIIVAVSTSVLSFQEAQQDTLIQKQQLEALKTLARPE